MGLRLFNVFFMTAVLVGMKAEALGMPGGLSEEKAVTPEVQALIDPVRSKVEEQLGHAVSQFKGVSYKTQVVAGINYFVKVDIGENDLVHIRVYHSLSDDVSLNNIEYPKARNHPITYF